MTSNTQPWWRDWPWIREGIFLFAEGIRILLAAILTFILAWDLLHGGSIDDHFFRLFVMTFLVIIWSDTAVQRYGN